MPPLPRQREELFCQAKLKGLTDDAAYVQAGYKRDRGNAHRLTTKDSIKARLAELNAEKARLVERHFVWTKQYVLDRLLEVVEKSLGRMPTPTGNADNPVQILAFRPEAANNALKMAGIELHMFVDRSQITHVNRDFDELSDEELLIKLRDEANALLLEHKAADVTPEDG